MGKKDPRVSDIIDRSAPFAQPVLKKLRIWVHRYCPDAEETLKWGHASFTYKGKILCTFAAFKEHCTFGFWHPLMREKERGQAWGQFGRMTGVRDLPTEEQFAGMVAQAMSLVDQGVKGPTANKRARPALPVPADLRAALERNAKAAGTFEGFSPSCQREYIEWITEAKQPATREKRLATTMEWLAEGKTRNWKYERKPATAGA